MSTRRTLDSCVAIIAFGMSWCTHAGERAQTCGLCGELNVVSVAPPPPPHPTFFDLSAKSTRWRCTRYTPCETSVLHDSTRVAADHDPCGGRAKRGRSGADVRPTGSPTTDTPF
eukprot:6104967-Prymnesium_polylepis.1